MTQRDLVPFEPVLIRAYKSAGGGLAFEGHVASEPAYVGQLQACQELLDRGVLSRVDVVRAGTTDLIGSLMPSDANPNSAENRIRRKMAENSLRR